MTLRPRPTRVALIAVIAFTLLAAAAQALNTHRTEARLLRLPADEIKADASLLAFADRRAPAIYASHCAQCHGAGRRGDAKRGAPDLGDAAWLFGTGEISDIESTIQYGIRSGHPKAHNITDMPAFLRINQLSPPEIVDVVEYVLSVSGQPHDADAAKRGSDLYANKGNCFDCHSSDALGNPDYGAPALTGPAWVYGGTRETLIDSVANGRARGVSVQQALMRTGRGGIRCR
ncbi:MAG: c-type cytochrome [Gammaproteobacteria bacterium]